MLLFGCLKKKLHVHLYKKIICHICPSLQSCCIYLAFFYYFLWSEWKKISKKCYGKIKNLHNRSAIVIVYFNVILKIYLFYSFDINSSFDVVNWHTFGGNEMTLVICQRRKISPQNVQDFLNYFLINSHYDTLQNRKTYFLFYESFAR